MRRAANGRPQACAQPRCWPTPEVAVDGRKPAWCPGATLSPLQLCQLNCSRQESRTVNLQLHHAMPLPTSAYPGDCYPLGPREFQRSLVYAGDARFRRVIHRVRQGLPTKIVVIGGSVALAHYDGVRSAHELFIYWLRQRYQTRSVNITFVTLAKAGSTSMWRLANLDDVRKEAADLILWDYTVCHISPNQT